MRRERIEESLNSRGIRARSAEGKRRTEGNGWKVSIVVKFRRAIHSSFSARVFPPRGALKFQNVATGRARMPTTFAASVCAAYAVHLYQHVSRNQFIFMMYRGSMTQRLAMLVSKPAGAGRNKMVEE